MKVNSKKYKLLIAFIIAIIWGYFADLRNGEIYWFFGRVIFIPLFVLILDKFRTLIFTKKIN